MTIAPDNNKKCLLFLSWQSDRSNCRNFVCSIVEKLPSQVSDIADVIIDRDTVNVPGSPDIGDTIFEKIDACDLFIADITVINDKNSGFRLMPNSNVLIELGYAIKALGWAHIILLNCSDYGNAEDLPFDINHRRICNFTIGANEDIEGRRVAKRKESKAKVLSNIAESIKLLKEDNQLFGGDKKKSPKFEIFCTGCNGGMSNMILIVRNVSSFIVSGLKAQGLVANFSDGSEKEVNCSPKFKRTALPMGEETALSLNNNILGAGPGNNNEYWTDVDVLFQMSCQDENDSNYWYEVRSHINNSNKAQLNENWSIRRIS